MYQIDSSGAVTGLPAPAGLGTPGFWSQGNAGSGILPTVLDQDWFNMVQNTLLLLQRVVGLSDSKSDYTQLYQAALSFARLVDTGAANALAAAPTLPSWATLPALSAIPDGFSVKVMPAHANTITAPTFAFNGGSAVTITDVLGNALQSGDIVANVPARLMKLGGGTPRWVLENPQTFPGHQATNGYIKLPGGTIVQWGEASIATGNGDVVTLPTSFPTAIMGIVATDYANGCHRPGWTRNGSSLSTFLAYAMDATNTNIAMSYGYVALGY